MFSTLYHTCGAKISLNELCPFDSLLKDTTILITNGFPVAISFTLSTFDLNKEPHMSRSISSHYTDEISPKS